MNKTRENEITICRKEKYDGMVPWKEMNGLYWYNVPYDDIIEAEVDETFVSPDGYELALCRFVFRSGSNIYTGEVKVVSNRKTKNQPHRSALANAYKIVALIYKRKAERATESNS